MKKIISIPPNYFYICIVINLVIFFILPKLNLIIFPINITGILFIGIGLYLVIHSYILFKKKNTPERFEEPKCIVKINLYRFSRNPQYLGGILTLFGLSILLGNILGFITPILFFLVMNFMFIPYEERVLEDTFGEEYIEYKNSSRRWV